MREDDDLGTPADIAAYLHTSISALAMLRHRSTGPPYIKAGRRVLYRWGDVREWLNRNTMLLISGQSNG